MTRAVPPEPHALVLGLGWFPDQAGGLNRYVRDLVLNLGADATAVVVGPAADAPATVAVVADHDAALLRRLVSYAGAVRRAARAASVVDAHFALYAAVPLRVGAARRLPVVMHFHGPWAAEADAGSAPNGHRGGGAGRVAFLARRAVERSVARRADRVVVLSAAFADLAAAHLAVPRGRIRVIPPAVDAERFSPADRLVSRAALGVPAEAFVAVTARRLVPRTGVDGLVDAWALVRGRCPDRELLLVVVGDGPERAAIESAATATGGVQVIGAVTDDELVRWFRAADVSVVPSRSLEGFGLVVAESLACGTPVVVTDVGGLPEAVAELPADLVVPAGDVAALAERLVAAIDGRAPLPPAEACRRASERFATARVLAAHRAEYAAAADGGTIAEDSLRVVLVDHTARMSGGEIAMLRLIEGVRAAAGDVEPSVVCFESGPLVEALRRARVPVTVLPLAARTRDMPRAATAPRRLPAAAVTSSVIQAWRVARQLRRERADVVHANSLKAGVIGGIAARVAGVPMVWHIRDRIAPDYLPAPTVRMLRRAIPRLASAVIANSNTTLDTLELPTGFPAIVAVDPYRPPPRAVRRPGAELRVGIVGRIAPWKGQDVFLDAFARAFPHGGARAVVAGAPLFGEDDVDGSLRRRATDLGIAERVDFLGFVEDVADLLAGLDVLVHASIIPEPHGQVVVEGMAAGCAVVAAAAGGPTEIITHEVDGILVPPGDADALAAALVRLAGDPALRVRLGAAARVRAAAMEPERVVPAVIALYRALVAGSRRRAP